MQHSVVRSLLLVLLLAVGAPLRVAVAQQVTAAKSPLHRAATPAPRVAAGTPTAAVQDKPPERWYQLELILFRYRHIASLVGSARPPAQSLDLADAMPLIEELPEFADEPASAMTIPVAFQRLPDSQLSLTGVFRRLARSSEIEPLEHVGWRQPSFGVEQSRRIRITELPPGSQGAAGASAGPDGLAPGARPTEIAPETYVPRYDGAARLRVGRYLVFDADFVFALDGTLVRLTESRRLLFGELHYFDHPDAGLLIMVTPFVIDRSASSGAIETDIDDTIVSPETVPADELD